MKDLIVSFSSNGRDNYNKSILRLIDSCKQYWPGDLLIYSPDHELWMYRDTPIVHSWPDPEFMHSYTHQEMPYQFKTALIQKALELGYKRIIWLDSSMQLTRDITPLLDESKTGIVTFHNLGHPTYKYLSDNAENLLREKGYLADWTPLNQIEQIWGGAFMLDFNKQNVVDFFEVLKEFSVNGSFKNAGSSRAGFVAHRHDQSVMSVLLHEKCDMLPYGTIVCPPHDVTGEYGRDYFLLCRGL